MENELFWYVHSRVPGFWSIQKTRQTTVMEQGDPNDWLMIGWWFGATLTFKKNKMGIIISHELWIQFRSPSSILWKPRYSGIKTMVSCNVSLKSIHWSCYIPLYRQFFWFSHYFAGAITFFSISPVQFSYIGYIPITSHDSFYPITSPLIG